jgi:hypothetical protein
MKDDDVPNRAGWLYMMMTMAFERLSGAQRWSESHAKILAKIRSTFSYIVTP